MKHDLIEQGEVSIKKRADDDVYVFGVRHLSPAASYHLEKFLNNIKPKVVLVEGPSDATEWIVHMVSKKCKPPIALLAYTNELPARTVLYPFAEYSPEYTAVKWASNNKAEAAFIDLPYSVFLGLQEQERLDKRAKEEAEVSNDCEGSCEDESDSKAEYSFEEVSEHINIYEKWAHKSGYDDYETYWEAEFEHNLSEDAYHHATYEFGVSIREFGDIDKENLIREAYMRRMIKKFVDKGVKPKDIVVVTGAYHSPAISIHLPVMTETELKTLPSSQATLTLMPYSNLRLSSRAGYGAGNLSPRYFGMMYKAMERDKMDELSTQFFTEIARYLRSCGTFRSTAEVIEAVRLAKGLASLKNQTYPTLSDLRSSAVTCLGQGEYSVVATALATIEVGTEMGELEEGVSRTAIQDDFYKQLTELKFDKYKSTVAQDLELDLRENRSAKTEKAQWLDLNRSYFLHRLIVIGNGFASIRASGQSAATWKEIWVLQWSTEAEIQLIESSLFGEAVEVAAAYIMKETLDKAQSVADITSVIEQAAKCGIPSMLESAKVALQSFTIDSDSFADISSAVWSLYTTISYGDIRKADIEGLKPLMTQLFYRGTLILEDNCKCNQSMAQNLFTHVNAFNTVSQEYKDIVDNEGWLATLRRVSDRDDLNPSLSGYACAILLERNLIDNPILEAMVSRRLSAGIGAELGAGWFEGLAGRNHYGIISRDYVWELLDSYIESLDDEAFKKALLFLRRAFSTFSAQEKSAICSNLGTIWNADKDIIENKLSSELTDSEKAVLEELNDFDFDDF